MKRLFAVYMILIGIYLVYMYNYMTQSSSSTSWNEVGLKGEIDETYVMVTFQAGIDYWRKCLKGFEDAAQALNVSVEYRGATQYDVHEQLTVLEQVIARKPAGIALTAIDPEALNEMIDKAIDSGIPVVLFDSGAPESRAYAFLGTDNYNAGATAAHKMAELLAETGKVAVITSPNQLNHQERTKGFRDTIHARYPKMQVVEILDGKGDQLESKRAAEEVMRRHPDLSGIFVTEANGGVGAGEAKRENHRHDLKIIGFDTDKGTLDMVKEGVISATLAQGTWKMGYWSLQFLFHLNHEIGDPDVPRVVDTGITVVTRENVDQFYAK